jgi:hypothetical protein
MNMVLQYLDITVATTEENDKEEKGEFENFCLPKWQLQRPNA